MNINFRGGRQPNYEYEYDYYTRNYYQEGVDRPTYGKVFNIAPKNPPIYVLIEGMKADDGTVIENPSQIEENALDKALGIKTNAEGLRYVVIPKGGAAFKYATKTGVACCGYDATNEYLGHMFGVSLDHADRIWYANHPKVESMGVPNSEMFSVLHGLVVPYGFGISRVIVKKGLSIVSEDFELWKEILGTNPMASLDSCVSNKEYIENVSAGNKELKELLEKDLIKMRWEYMDKKSLPQEAFAVFCSVAANTPNAMGGGHASYKSPRNTPGDWIVAVQFDRLSNITYANLPKKDFTKYSMEHLKVLDVWASKNSDKATIESFKARAQKQETNVVKPSVVIPAFTPKDKNTGTETDVTDDIFINKTYLFNGVPGFVQAKWKEKSAIPGADVRTKAIVEFSVEDLEEKSQTEKVTADFILNTISGASNPRLLNTNRLNRGKVWTATVDITKAVISCHDRANNSTHVMNKLPITANRVLIEKRAAKVIKRDYIGPKFDELITVSFEDTGDSAKYYTKFANITVLPDDDKKAKPDYQTPSTIEDSIQATDKNKNVIVKKK